MKSLTVRSKDQEIVRYQLDELARDLGDFEHHKEKTYWAHQIGNRRDTFEMGFVVTKTTFKANEAVVTGRVTKSTDRPYLVGKKVSINAVTGLVQYTF